MGRSAATVKPSLGHRKAAARGGRQAQRGPSRHGRGDRGRLHPGPGGPGIRGPGVRDSHRLDGPDPDGPPQGSRLPPVRLRLLPSTHRKRSRALRFRRHGLLGTLRQLPVSGRGLERRAELQGRPHPGDDVPVRPAVPARVSGPPERWDVVVFRYPEEPEVSYIKRLVGLPGETIRIYSRRRLRQECRAATVSPGPQAAAASVGDADRASTTTAIGRRRWRTSPSGSAGKPRAGGWKIVDPAEQPVSSRRRRPSDEWVELRYQHLVPDPEQWDAILERPHAAARAPRPR